MVTIIETSCDLRAITNYNQKKVTKQVAECIGISGYHKDLDELSPAALLVRLQHQADLRPSVTKPGVHITLNFDPSERLSREKLLQITADYMEGIGFSEQPYIVYQHHDAGHPHLHVVTTSIDQNGIALELSNIGRNKSEPTRLALEKKYGLVVATDSDKQTIFQPIPVNLRSVTYGQTDTRSAISKVLSGVLKQYNYTSLAELNALLRLYNVTADRGTEDSRVFKNNGLYYHVIDSLGNKVGKPIKASRFFSRPTLSFLQKQFNANEQYRKQHRREKTQLRNAIDMLLLTPGRHTAESLAAELKQQGIDMVMRRTAEGRLYGLTFIDHRNRHVFKGSDLGTEYSAASLTRRLKSPAQQITAAPKTFTSRWPTPPFNWTPPTFSHENHSHTNFTLLETLFQPEYDGQQLPWHLRIGQKKKKRRGRRSQTRT